MGLRLYDWIMPAGGLGYGVFVAFLSDVEKLSSSPTSSKS